MSLMDTGIPSINPSFLLFFTRLSAASAISLAISNEEVQWVRMAIKAEADRAALRKAIIEKSLASLFWLAIVAAGGWAADYITAHWKA